LTTVSQNSGYPGLIARFDCLKKPDKFFTRNSGYTLVDVILVVMIIGIVGMVAIPQFHSMIRESKLNEAAGELVSALEYARSLAVEYQKPFGLAVTGNRIRVYDDGRKTNPNPDHAALPPVDAFGVVLNPADKKWYLKDFDAINNYEGVTIDSAPAGGEIRFFPDGHCADPAGPGNTLVVGYAGYHRTITVNGMTGWVSVQ
jgi:type II secretion system protein H